MWFDVRKIAGNRFKKSEISITYQKYLIMNLLIIKSGGTWIYKQFVYIKTRKNLSTRHRYVKNYLYVIKTESTL